MMMMMMMMVMIMIMIMMIAMIIINMITTFPLQYCRRDRSDPNPMLPFTPSNRQAFATQVCVCVCVCVQVYVYV